MDYIAVWITTAVCYGFVQYLDLLRLVVEGPRNDGYLYDFEEDLGDDFKEKDAVLMLGFLGLLIENCFILRS